MLSCEVSGAGGRRPWLPFPATCLLLLRCSYGARCLMGHMWGGPCTSYWQRPSSCIRLPLEDRDGGGQVLTPFLKSQGRTKRGRLQRGTDSPVFLFLLLQDKCFQEGRAANEPSLGRASVRLLATRTQINADPGGAMFPLAWDPSQASRSL